MRYEALARAMFHDAGGGKRGTSAGIVASAFCLLLISTMIAGCGLDSPSSPATPGDLTGQATNQQFTFSGTIGVTSFTATVAADDRSTVTIAAAVNDSAGNPINNYTQVTFRTDLGGFVVGIDSATGNNIAAATAKATTFNGVAEVEFQSVNRQAGTATITANISSTTGSAKVVLEEAAIFGTLSLGFGSGAGPITKTDSASQNKPLDVTVGVVALDLEGKALPGANVRFNIVEDTTTDNGSPNDAARWLASRNTFTGSLGDAVNIMRVYGRGVVVVDADLIDPVTDNVIARSNRIILTTTAALIVKLAFPDGTAAFTANAPYDVGLISTVYDGTNTIQPGLQVRFSILTDSTGGATLSSTIGTTDAGGQTTSSVHLPGPGSVTIKAALYDAQNNEIASATVVATGT